MMKRKELTTSDSPGIVVVVEWMNGETAGSHSFGLQRDGAVIYKDLASIFIKVDRTSTSPDNDWYGLKAFAFSVVDGHEVRNAAVVDLAAQATSGTEDCLWSRPLELAKQHRGS